MAKPKPDTWKMDALEWRGRWLALAVFLAEQVDRHQQGAFFPEQALTRAAHLLLADAAKQAQAEMARLTEGEPK